MRVVVLGAGVIGVTSAGYLAKAGHEVTVVDRQAGPALETSFANAGEFSPGYASPWAAGVSFRFGTSIDRLDKAGDRIVAVQSSGGRLSGAACAR